MARTRRKPPRSNCRSSSAPPNFSRSPVFPGRRRAARVSFPLFRKVADEGVARHAFVEGALAHPNGFLVGHASAERNEVRPAASGEREDFRVEFGMPDFER